LFEELVGRVGLVVVEVLLDLFERGGGGVGVAVGGCSVVFRGGVDGGEGEEKKKKEEEEATHFFVLREFYVLEGIEVHLEPF